VRRPAEASGARGKQPDHRNLKINREERNVEATAVDETTVGETTMDETTVGETTMDGWRP
jgi:hypothetical protein